MSTCFSGKGSLKTISAGLFQIAFSLFYVDLKSTLAKRDNAKLATKFLYNNRALEC
jgi:hypothetical protein